MNIKRFFTNIFSFNDKNTSIDLVDIINNPANIYHNTSLNPLYEVRKNNYTNTNINTVSNTIGANFNSDFDDLNTNNDYSLNYNDTFSDDNF